MECQITGKPRFELGMATYLLSYMKRSLRAMEMTLSSVKMTDWRVE